MGVLDFPTVEQFDKLKADVASLSGDVQAVKAQLGMLGLGVGKTPIAYCPFCASRTFRPVREEAGSGYYCEGCTRLFAVRVKDTRGSTLYKLPIEGD